MGSTVYCINQITIDNQTIKYNTLAINAFGLEKFIFIYTYLLMPTLNAKKYWNFMKNINFIDITGAAYYF